MVVYRDGVSEGEYWQVTNAEVGRIKRELCVLSFHLRLISCFS